MCPKRHSPGERTTVAVRPGIGAAVERITASELMQPMLLRKQRWQRQLNQQRRKGPVLALARRQAEEWLRSWEQEPRSCCRKHSE